MPATGAVADACLETSASPSASRISSLSKWQFFSTLFPQAVRCCFFFFRLRFPKLVDIGGFGRAVGSDRQTTVVSLWAVVKHVLFIRLDYRLLYWFDHKKHLLAERPSWARILRDSFLIGRKWTAAFHHRELTLSKRCCILTKLSGIFRPEV